MLLLRFFSPTLFILSRWHLGVWERRGSNVTWWQKERVALHPWGQVLVLSSGSAMKHLAWFLSSYITCWDAVGLIWPLEWDGSTQIWSLRTPFALGYEVQQFFHSASVYNPLQPFLMPLRGHRGAAGLLQTKYWPWGAGHGVAVFTGLALPSIAATLLPPQHAVPMQSQVQGFTQRRAVSSKAYLGKGSTSLACSWVLPSFCICLGCFLSSPQSRFGWRGEDRQKEMRALEPACPPCFPSSVFPVYVPVGRKKTGVPFFQNSDPHCLDMTGGQGFVPTVWNTIVCLIWGLQVPWWRALQGQWY